MRKRTLIAGTVSILGLLAIYRAGDVVSILIDLHILSAQDEAPIIVRNGSLVIVAGDAKDNTWTFKKEPDGDNENPEPSYSHEPVHKYRDRSRKHWVKLVQPSAQAACTPGVQKAEGSSVEISYTYNTGMIKTVIIDRGASGVLAIDYR